MHGRVLATQLPDRPRDRARGGRPAPGDQIRELLHEHLPRVIVITAPPDPLPPHDLHPRRPGHVMQHPPVTAAAVATTPHDEHPVEAE